MLVEVEEGFEWFALQGPGIEHELVLRFVSLKACLPALKRLRRNWHVAQPLVDFINNFHQDLLLQ
jgi:hypothetical protein